MRRLVLWLIVGGAVFTALVVVTVTVIALAVEDNQRAVRSAEGDAAVVASVLELGRDQETLRAAVARTAAGREGRLSIRIDGSSAVGTTHPLNKSGVVSQRQVTTANGRPAVIETVVPAWRPSATFVQLMALLAATAAAAVGLAVAVGRRLLRPVETELELVTAAGWSIARGGPWEPTGSRLLPEAAELERVLRAITRHADQLRSSERELMSDLSHRLRTPLTSLALDGEAIGDGEVAQRIRKAVSALESDVDAIIRATRPQVELPSRCDVVAVVRDRMTFWAALADHAGRCCHVELVEGPAMVALTARDLAAVVDALLGNVFGHTPDACAIAVSVVRYAGWITIVVEDAGPGVADPESSLRRGASGGGSTGLGLAIARSAVEATGGTIHIERGRLGGARIRLRLGERGAGHSAAGEPRAWRLWREHRVDEPE